MTDEDTIKRVNKFFKDKVTVVRMNDPKHQTTFVTKIYGIKAATWMKKLYPLMSKRRKAQIRGALKIYHSRVEVGARKRINEIKKLKKLKEHMSLLQLSKISKFKYSPSRIRQLIRD